MIREPKNGTIRIIEPDTIGYPCIDVFIFVDKKWIRIERFIDSEVKKFHVRQFDVDNVVKEIQDKLEREKSDV